MKKIIIYLFLLPIFALGQPTVKTSFTLEECIQIAIKNNNNLKSSKARLNNTESKYLESKTNALPSLKFIGNYSRLSDIDPFEIQLPAPISRTVTVSPSLLNNTNLKLNLQQPLFTGSRISSMINMADLNYQASEEDFQKDKFDLITNVKILYYNIIKSRHIVANVKENINRLESHIKRVENFLSQGQSTKNDLLKVEVQYYNLKAALVDAENMFRISKLNLASIMGNISVPEFEIIEVELGEESVESLDYYLKTAYEKRNDLKSITKKMEMSEYGISIAQSNWYPQIYLNANYTYANPNPRIMPAKDKFVDTWDIGVSVSFDIWNWMSSAHKVEQARAQFSEIKSGYDSFKDYIILEVNQNYLNIKRNKESLAFQKKSLEQAEENYKISKEKYDKGFLSSSELLDSETALYETKNNYINTLIDYNISVAKLNNSSANLKY